MYTHLFFYQTTQSCNITLQMAKTILDIHVAGMDTAIFEGYTIMSLQPLLPELK